MAAKDPVIEIRSARVEDAAALVPLLDALGFPASAEAIAARFESAATAPSIALVAVRNETPVGVLTGHVTPVLHRPTPVGRITMLVVAGSVRGHGIGRALVEAAERILAERGCALVEVTSNQSRVEAHAFYERLGYEVTSLRFKKALA